MGYLNVKFRPDLIQGDTTVMIADDRTDTPFSDGDVLFDWHAVDIPKGATALKGITVVVNGKNGSRQSLQDIQLVFATDVDGVAPPTLGVVNDTASAIGTQNHIIGGISLDAIPINKIDTYAVLGQYSAASQKDSALPVLEGELSSTQGFQRVYVGGLCTNAYDFATNTLVNGAIDASATSGKTITVDGTDARKVFSKGDLVYVSANDTQIPGKVESVTSTVITFDTVNSTVDIADNAEVLCATPIKIILHLED